MGWPHPRTPRTEVAPKGAFPFSGGEHAKTHQPRSTQAPSAARSSTSALGAGRSIA